jgi:hypothetical protein
VTRNAPAQYVVVRHDWRVTVPSTPRTPPSADVALLRAALGLPPGASPVVRTSADPATYPTS